MKRSVEAGEAEEEVVEECLFLRVVNVTRGDSKTRKEGERRILGELNGTMLNAEQFVAEVKDCQSGLRAFIRSLGVDPMWVDDVAQEALVIAYERREHFDVNQSFRNWVWGIARNCVMNDRRKSARRSRILHENVADILTATAGEPEASLELCDDEQARVAALRDCLAEMPEKSRSLLQRRYAENERAVDLAESFEMNAAAVRKSLERIRAALRRCMEAKLAGGWPAPASFSNWETA